MLGFACFLLLFDSNSDVAHGLHGRGFLSDYRSTNGILKRCQRNTRGVHWGATEGVKKSTKGVLMAF